MPAAAPPQAGERTLLFVQASSLKAARKNQAVTWDRLENESGYKRFFSMGG